MEEGNGCAQMEAHTKDGHQLLVDGEEMLKYRVQGMGCTLIATFWLFLRLRPLNCCLSACSKLFLHLISLCDVTHCNVGK